MIKINMTSSIIRLKHDKSIYTCVKNPIALILIHLNKHIKKYIKEFHTDDYTICYIQH